MAAKPSDPNPRRRLPLWARMAYYVMAPLAVLGTLACLAWPDYRHQPIRLAALLLALCAGAAMVAWREYKVPGGGKIIGPVLAVVLVLWHLDMIGERPGLLRVARIG